MNDNAQLYSTSHLRVSFLFCWIYWHSSTGYVLISKLNLHNNLLFYIFTSFNLFYSNNWSLLQSHSGHISHFLCRNLCSVTAIQFSTRVLDFSYYISFWDYFIWCWYYSKQSRISQMLRSLYTFELSDDIYGKILWYIFKYPENRDSGDET